MRRVEDDLWVPEEEDIRPCFLTPRYVLQMLGTDWGRHCYEDTWAKLAIRISVKLAYEGTYTYNQKKGLQKTYDSTSVKTSVAIPDLRFRNEMQIIRSAGGLTVRVNRPGAGLLGATGNHPSEVEMRSIRDDEFDLVILNDHDLLELRARVRLAARQLQGLRKKG